MAIISSNYSIPMKGNGAYNAHSELQREALIEALPLLRTATLKATQNSLSTNTNILRVIEYGASHGANSWQDNMDKTQYPHKIFVSSIPRSFYEPLNATRDLDVGYCFTCLHYLEEIPNYPGCHFTAVHSSETTSKLRAQAQTDLQKFLQLRASEFVPGGQLVLSLLATGFDNPDFMNSGLRNAMQSAMSQMFLEGKLSQEAIEACVLPVYYRTTEDIQATLATEEVIRQWTVVKIEQSQVIHPFWKELEFQKEQELYTEEHSIAYAKAMVSWFWAAFEGFALRAIIGTQPHDPEESIQNLLEEMKEKAIRVFLEKYKDNPVYMSSVFVHLEAKVSVGGSS
ncbi:hypothetical protein THAR02_01444 [Trichoderma harzianum]|uniref:Uncharacterized protein n=1 Tax=Trichoderma harzianum TaxID=5544 RepID=A0A0F9XP83_TRIHA|nr:hypothetical protein THAR02_01444 [Trichoderma harzianum]